MLLFLGPVLLSLVRHRALRSVWPWLAGALALALWMPNLVWQVQNGLPVVEMSQAVAGGSSATSEPRALLLPFQLLLAVPIWTVGLWHLWRSPRLRPWRRLALAYVIALVIVLVAGGKPYYTAGFFPLLLAVAAVWSDEHGRRARRLVVSTSAVFAVVGVLLFLPVLPVRWLHLTPIPAINTDASETVGWPQFAATVGTVHDESGADVVIGDNYGEAGAMLRFRPEIDTVSPHNSLWDLGGPPPGATLAVMVGFEESDLSFCDDLSRAAVIDNGVDLDNEEQGQVAWLCHPDADWTAIWPTLRHLN